MNDLKVSQRNRVEHHEIIRLDERYLGTLISYTTNATGANAGSPTYQVGGPRFASVSLSVDF